MDENKENQNCEEDCGLVYVNNPIYDENKDWIGLSHYIHRLKSAIKKNASMIAITSVFGGGKSSLSNLLIDELEKQNENNDKESWKFWKKDVKKDIEICTINMWSQVNSGDNDHLHKTFLYQLSGCIGKNDSYIGKLLSKNFGLIKLDTNFVIGRLRKILLLILVSLFLLFHLFYNEWIATFPDFKLYIQIARYGFLLSALIVGYNMLKKSGIVFSSSKSESSRVLDEIEYYQIYKEIILKSHSKKIVIIVEDLDRSTNVLSVVNFLSELNKYYITPKINDKKVTFIFNIKSEAELKLDLKKYTKEMELNDISENVNYEKIFDYTINLRKINIDDYAVVLKNILNQDEAEIKKFCEENNLKINDVYTDLKWLIKGSKVNLRVLKNRIDDTFTLYKTLAENQGVDYIEFRKCAISSYLFSEYAEELQLLEDNVFYEIVLRYIQKKIHTESDIEELQEFDETFQKEIYNLLELHYIDIDYRLYFYNTPKNVPCYKVNELRVINLITYDNMIGNSDEDLINGVGKDIISNSIKQRIDLGLKLPNIIYKNRLIFEVTLCDYYKELLADLVNKVDNNKCDFKLIQDKIDMLIPHLADIVGVINQYGSGELITDFRKYILANYYEYTMQVKPLFFNGHSVIDKEEMKLIIDVNVLIDLINIESKEYNNDVFSNLSEYISKSISMMENLNIIKIIEFYKKSFLTLDTACIVLCFIEVCEELHIIPEELEEMITELLTNSEVIEKFKELIDIIDSEKIENHTLEFIVKNDLDVISLYEKICLFYDVDILFYFNTMCKERLFEKLNFKDDKIVSVIKENIADISKADYYLELRLYIVEFVQNFIDYKFIFEYPYDFISREELVKCNDISKGIYLIDLSQVSIENSVYIIDAFSEMCNTKDDIFLIHSFVSEIEEEDICKALFNEIDYNLIRFNDLNKYQKQSLINQYTLHLDLKTNEEKLKFMKATNYLYTNFEEQFTNENLKEEQFVTVYVDLIKECPNRITNTTIKNIKKMNKYYIFNERVEKKFLDKGLMIYYITSKTKRLKFYEFDISNEKYMKDSIYMFQEDGFEATSRYMVKSMPFMEYLLNHKLFKDITYTKFKYFNIFDQTEELLACLFDSDYSIKDITDYLSTIQGFDSIESASYFVNRVVNENQLLGDDGIFDHTYPKLINPALKTKYRKAKNKCE